MTDHSEAVAVVDALIAVAYAGISISYAIAKSEWHRTFWMLLSVVFALAAVLRV